MASYLGQSIKSHEFRAAKYVFPPPQFDDLAYNYKMPTPPFKGAETWKCSLYYFWYEYLRRHDGYRKTCLSNGKGKYAKLYNDFGDVHQLSFIDWWREYFCLFQEPRAIRRVDRERILNTLGAKFVSTKLYIEIDLSHDLQKLSHEFNEVAWIYKNVMLDYIKNEKEISKNIKSDEVTNRGKIHRSQISQAIYPVYANPTLSSLYEHLRIWDIHIANPTATAVDIANIADIRVNNIVQGENIRELKKLNPLQISNVL